MIKRVAKRLWHHAGPSEKLILRIGISGNDFLWLAIGAHGTPFVVIALEPHLTQIGKLTIFGDFTGWKVIMVVENGLAYGVIMVQPPCGLII